MRKSSYRQHQLQYLVLIAPLCNFLFPALIFAAVADTDFRPHQLKTAVASSAALFAFARRGRNYLSLSTKAGNPYERIIPSVSEKRISKVKYLKQDKEICE